MVGGSLRSRTYRRVKVKTPGGRTVTHYRRRKPQSAHCGGCGQVLQGIPREFPATLQNMPKTAKRPERPYGGVLCSPCMRKVIIEKVRGGSA